jgi:hypothetical protein
LIYEKIGRVRISKISLTAVNIGLKKRHEKKNRQKNVTKKKNDKKTMKKKRRINFVGKVAGGLG